MDTLKAILSLAMLILEIVLIVKLFISFKQIKELTIENQNMRSLIKDIAYKQKQAFENQNKKIDEIIEKINNATNK